MIPPDSGGILFIFLGIIEIKATDYGYSGSQSSAETFYYFLETSDFPG